MRKVVANTFVSLDGVMQAPGGPEEDPSGGFRHGGWSAGYWDDEMGKDMESFMTSPFDLLLGRKTYEIFAAHWPYVMNDPAADALNRATKYVASRSLSKADWQHSVILKGDAAEQVAGLKRGTGPDLQVHGSGDLLQTLIRHNLVDQFQVWMFPVLLGGGKRLFAGGTVPAGLTLVSSRAYGTGVVAATYHPAGTIKYGSFAQAEPSAAEVERRRKMQNEMAR